MNYYASTSSAFFFPSLLYSHFPLTTWYTCSRVFVRFLQLFHVMDVSFSLQIAPRVYFSASFFILFFFPCIYFSFFFSITFRINYRLLLLLKYLVNFFSRQFQTRKYFYAFIPNKNIIIHLHFLFFFFFHFHNHYESISQW